MKLENYHQTLRSKLNSNIANNDAISMIKQYQFISLEFQDNKHQHFGNFYLAQVLFKKGELNRAASILKLCALYFKAENYEVFLHETYILLGKIKQHQGNVEENLVYLEMANKINPENAYFRAASTFNLSMFLIDFHAYDEALEKLKKSLKWLSVYNENECNLYFDLLLQIAKIYLLKKQETKCYNLLLSIQKIMNKRSCNEIYTKLLLGFANYYQSIKENNKAIEYYLLALQESFNKQQKLLNLSSKVALSSLYLAENNLKAAEKILLGTLNDYKQEDKTLYLSLLNNLYTLYDCLEKPLEKEKFKEELDYNSDY